MIRVIGWETTQEAIDKNVADSRKKEAEIAKQRDKADDVAAYSVDVVRCNALRLAEDLAFLKQYEDVFLIEKCDKDKKIPDWVTGLKGNN